MSLFLKLVAVLRAAWPLPTFRDAAEVTSWITGEAGPLGDFIAACVNQFAATGEVEIDLPDGRVIVLMADSSGRLLMVAADYDILAQALADETGEPKGKWLDAIKKIVAILIQILPFFLKPAPAPLP